jgi:hypothetical protein
MLGYILAPFHGALVGFAAERNWIEVIALRHQLAVLHRQHPGRLRLSELDRLLWIWLYCVSPPGYQTRGLARTGYPRQVGPF